MYHRLTSAVHAARTDSPADMLSARIASKVELCVVSMILNTVACNDVSDWTGVDIAYYSGLCGGHKLSGIENTKLTSAI